MKLYPLIAFTQASYRNMKSQVSLLNITKTNNWDIKNTFTIIPVVWLSIFFIQMLLFASPSKFCLRPFFSLTSQAHFSA